MALNLIKTFMSLLFPLITFPYASRILMPEGIGKVVFAQSIITYFAMFASLGIGAYGVREAAKIRDNKLLLSRFSKEIFTINIIATFFAYLIFAICLFAIPNIFVYRKLLCICSASILFSTLGMDWLYNALEDYQYITIRSIAFQLISLIFLFVVVHKENDYLWYAAISVGANVGSNICNFIHSRKFISFRHIHHLQLKKHLKAVFILFFFSCCF